MKAQFKYIYVLFIPEIRYLYRAKIGISNDVARRVKEIRDSIWNETRKEANVKVFVKIPFIATEHWEGRIHRITRPLSAKMHGSGRTEWRWSINPFFAFLCGFLGINFDYPNADVMRFLILCFLPLPIDFALLVITVFFVELTMLAAVLFITYKILSNVI